MSTLTEAPIHPVASANRVAKAQRVVAFMDEHESIFGGPVSASTAADFQAATWRLINEAMGEQRPMSDLTVATVIGLLAGRGA